MILVQDAQAFSFDYTAFDQDPSLNVSFDVYDVTTGTAVFVQSVPGVYAAFGSYLGRFTGAAPKTYLVIGAVYTDNTFTTVDTSRAPSSDVYQVIFSSVQYCGFAYAAYDLNPSLNLQASVYDMTSGTPVFVQTASMAFVENGVYFGSFTGLRGHTYQILSVVYTNNLFTTPDLSRSAGSTELDCFVVSTILVASGSALLIGQQQS